MISFTDSNLASLKENVKHDDFRWTKSFDKDVGLDQLRALLNRLEAAEKIVNLNHGCEAPENPTENGHCCIEAEKAEEAWRKAAGK